MSARCWDARRARQHGAPDFIRWVPTSNLPSPEMELLLHGSYCTEHVWERRITRARRLRAERFARRQRRRHVPRFHTANWIDAAWIIAATKPSAALEAFTREYLGVPWSRPDADPLADMQTLRGHKPVAVWLDEIVEMEMPDA